MRRLASSVLDDTNNFTLFSLDFSDQKYRHADLLISSVVLQPTHVRALTRWAQFVMPMSLWLEDPVSFSPIIQCNTYSCDVIILSTIAAIILSILVWKPQDAAIFTLISLLLLQFCLIDQPWHDSYRPMCSILHVSSIHLLCWKSKPYLNLQHHKSLKLHPNDQSLLPQSIMIPCLIRKRQIMPKPLGSLHLNAHLVSCRGPQMIGFLWIPRNVQTRRWRKKTMSRVGGNTASPSPAESMGHLHHQSRNFLWW